MSTEHVDVKGATAAIEREYTRTVTWGANKFVL